MLTVKHIEPSGHETVMEIRRATLQPDPRTLFLEMADGTVKGLTEGRFFIMNNAGQTVARYVLDVEMKASVLHST
jgi:hypothetical protein